MRYYYYGNDEQSWRRKDQNMAKERTPYQQEDGLVIDEDSVYEIDLECIHCKENNNKFRKN